MDWELRRLYLGSYGIGQWIGMDWGVYQNGMGVWMDGRTDQGEPCLLRNMIWTQYDTHR